MFEIVQGQPGKADFTFYGGAREFVRYKGSEAILHGPAETGKTISTLTFLHLCALKYPKASIVICRKTLTSTYGSVLQTYQNKVLGVTGIFFLLAMINLARRYRAESGFENFLFVIEGKLDQAS